MPARTPVRGPWSAAHVSQDSVLQAVHTHAPPGHPGRRGGPPFACAVVPGHHDPEHCPGGLHRMVRRAFDERSGPSFELGSAGHTWTDELLGLSVAAAVFQSPEWLTADPIPREPGPARRDVGC